ncbi:MAG: chemotaxis protein CheB [Spirochaetota bacterium]|nr:chemotaxis protein CheB [Spirochaetota bacterium]
MEKKKILIAEDNEANAELLLAILRRAGYSADVSNNGKKAFDTIKRNKYDALLTDWMMPEMDGIELIRRVRDTIKPVPIIVIITALSSPEARKHALDSGSDDFIVKPYDPQDIITRLDNLFNREKQPFPSVIPKQTKKYNISAPFTGVCIAASSGGPQTLKKILSTLTVTKDAAFFIVQHSPSWALEDMAKRWNEISTMEIILSTDGIAIDPGKIYLAPGKTHMTVEPGSMKIRLLDDPPENYVKPAADPLFRSVAKSFGKRSIAVIVTGMGRDGALGASHINATAGIVIAQDPETAIVKSMPATVIKTIPSTIVVPLSEIPETVNKYIEKLSVNKENKILHKVYN